MSHIQQQISRPQTPNGIATTTTVTATNPSSASSFTGETRGAGIGMGAGEQRKTFRERTVNGGINSRDLPAGPPAEILRDVTSDSFSTHAYSWPILFAIIPPMGALVYGKSDVWSDFLLLLLIAFYLYNIIKVPWELYYAARSRRVINENTFAGQTADSALEARRQMAARELRHAELYALGLVIASPMLGGFALHYAKQYLTDYDKYISHFNIALFVFAAGIRPLMHVASLAKNRTLHLQEQVHYPNTEVELLKRRVQHLEYEFSQLRRGFATKRDIDHVRNGIEPTISQLNKAVRKHEKKEQYLRNYSEERFAFLESKLREYDSFISYKLQEDQAMTLPRSMMQVIFLPLNVTFTILGYAKYFLPLPLRGRQKHMVTGSNLEDDNLIMNHMNNNETSQQENSGSGQDLQKY
ncbi:10711_t:CDS:2 [Ambispora leptoticha]|uniref:10711_t:CDS:1 n=1 Tax=Ambispora leptoticha TaxID=144679 RepID=A0A9N8ZJV6_9GLOM|nr:10711_t:CDS:2 [Ambispora leptoticha]